MPHVDPDVLALVALGEPVASEAEERHLADCAACAGTLAELRTTASVGRASRGAEPLMAPPARVWEGIAAELGLPDDIRPESARSESAARPEIPRSESTARPDSDRYDDTASVNGSSSIAPPVPLAERRSRRRLLLPALVAAAAVVALSTGIPALQSALRPPEPTVVAEATLEAFPDWPDARGAAVLEELPDGTQQVEVSLDAAVGDDGFREVWLIREDASDLVSLGVLEGSAGTFVVPAGVDVDEFSLVDVSEEPRDGDPAHSGDSIVRGSLS